MTKLSSELQRGSARVSRIYQSILKTNQKSHWQARLILLCVSCPSANKFSTILFSILARSCSISPRSFQCFRRSFRRNFNWIRQQMNTFPIDPYCKSARFRQRYNIAESGHILQWGSIGKMFTRCRIWMKFCTRVRLKPSNDPRRILAWLEKK